MRTLAKSNGLLPGSSGPSLDIDPRRDMRPQCHAAGWYGEPQGRSQLPAEGFNEHRAANHVFTAHAANVSLYFTNVQQIGDRAFKNLIALRIDKRAESRSRFDQRSRRNDKADAQPWDLR